MTECRRRRTMLECNCIETNTRAEGLTERVILGLLFSRVSTPLVKWAWQEVILIESWINVERLMTDEFNALRRKSRKGWQCDSIFDNALHLRRSISLLCDCQWRWFANLTIYHATDPSTAITLYCNVTIAGSLFLMHFAGVHSMVPASWTTEYAVPALLFRDVRSWRLFDGRHSRLSAHLISVKPHTIPSWH